MAPDLPLPCLTLRLSSPSFLETVLTDHAARPLFSTETAHGSTVLSRCDPLRGLTLVASVRWPEQQPPPRSLKGKCRDAPAAAATAAHVLIDGSLMSEDEFLRRNVLSSSRKFHIPGCSQTLKWKRTHGGVFQCTASGGGALVALFEPAVFTARARLSLFVPTLPGLADCAPAPVLAPPPVSAVLTHYLIVSALLLLTHPADLHGLAPAPLAIPSAPASPSPSSSSSSSSSSSFPFPSPSSSRSPSVPYALQIPRAAAAGSSVSTPVSPITSAVSDDAIPPSRAFAARHPRTTQSLSALDLFWKDEDEDEDLANFEPPPPYEEIQWTVRVRQPRSRPCPK